MLPWRVNGTPESVPIARRTPALWAALKSRHVGVDRGFCLLGNMRRNAGSHTVGHDVADGGRRRDQHGAPRQHHVDAFPVDEIAVFDRVDAGRGCRLIPSAPWACALAVFPASWASSTAARISADSELRIADVGAGSEDSAAGDELDVVSAGLDLLARGTPDLVGAVDLPAEQMPAVSAGHAQRATAQHQAEA